MALEDPVQRRVLKKTIFCKHVFLQCGTTETYVERQDHPCYAQREVFSIIKKISQISIRIKFRPTDTKTCCNSPNMAGHAGSGQSSTCYPGLKIPSLFFSPVTDAKCQKLLL